MFALFHGTQGEENTYEDTYTDLTTAQKVAADFEDGGEFVVIRPLGEPVYMTTDEEVGQ